MAKTHKKKDMTSVPSMVARGLPATCITTHSVFRKLEETQSVYVVYETLETGTST